MKIYTKTGDDGTTALPGGGRVGKDDPRIAVCGDVDELTAHAGFAAAFTGDAHLRSTLQRIQGDLFALGARLADPARLKRPAKAEFGEDKVAFLEAEIDRMDGGLEPLRNFILPGGSPAAATLHLCRAVCRRAERALVAFSRLEAVDLVFFRYLNRLSDYYFVAARFAIRLGKNKDVPW